MISWFDTLDNACGFMPAALRVGSYGLVAGVLTMLLYRWISPQTRIKAIKVRLAEAQSALRAYAGTDFKQMSRLSWHAISLAARHVLLVTVPTLMSAIPVLMLMAWLESRYGHRSIWPSGPTWLRSWHATLMLTMTVGALITKYRFKIA